jgi:hypothetical protein
MRIPHLNQTKPLGILQSAEKRGNVELLHLIEHPQVALAAGGVKRCASLRSAAPYTGFVWMKCGAPRLQQPLPEE